jgi:hypothetical protein
MHTTFRRTSAPNNSVSQSVSISWAAGLRTPHIHHQKMPSTVRRFSPVFTSRPPVAPPSPISTPWREDESRYDCRQASTWSLEASEGCGVWGCVCMQCSFKQHTTLALGFAQLEKYTYPEWKVARVCRGAHPTIEPRRPSMRVRQPPHDHLHKFRGCAPSPGAGGWVVSYMAFLRFVSL